jgi:hypothetical protein
MIKVKVTARRYTYEDLKTQLMPEERILILSCDSCAKLNNGLGGEEGAKRLAKKLMDDGFDVAHHELLNVACSPDELKGRLNDLKFRELFEGADVIIPLSCSAGIERFGEAMPKIRILLVTETLGLGTYSPETGVHLTEPFPDIELEINDEEGISLAEAAERLGLYTGSF